MLSALYKAFAQASDPRSARIVKGAVAAIILFVVLVSAAAWGLQYLTLTGPAGSIDHRRHRQHRP